MKNLSLKKPQKRTIVILALLILSLLLYSAYISSLRYKGEVEAIIMPSIAEVAGKIVSSEIDLGRL